MAEEIKDDRIIYIAVRLRGDGVLVEGGFNHDFEWLDKEKRKFVLKLALDAIVANGVAMFPDDKKWRETLEKRTDLGKGEGPRWTTEPPTPPQT